MRIEPSTSSAPGATPSNDETVRMLFDLLSKGTSPNTENPNARPAWDKRKALVCTSEPYREIVARKLSACGLPGFYGGRHAPGS